MPTTPEISWPMRIRLNNGLIENPSPEVDPPGVAIDWVGIAPECTPQVLPAIRNVRTRVEVAVAAPGMKWEDERLASYSHCSHIPEGVFVTKLATLGYFYHVSSDTIICFCCGLPYGNGHSLECPEARDKLSVPFRQCMLSPQRHEMTTTTANRVTRDSNPRNVNRQLETGDQRGTTTFEHVLCISGETTDYPLLPPPTTD